MKFYQHSVIIKALPLDIWKKLSNVPDWPTWDKSLSSCKLFGSFTEGGSGAFKPSKGPLVKFKLINVFSEKKFDVQANLPFCNKMTVEHDIETCHEGTKLTHSIVFEGWLSWFFARVIGRGLKASLPGAMNALKHNVEKA